MQVGYDMTKKAAEKCFKKAGLKPTDVDVIELHDCFSVNEFITYEALGLCPEGNSISEALCFIKMGSATHIFLLLHTIRVVYWTGIIHLNAILANLEEKASCLCSNIKKTCKLWNVFNKLRCYCGFYRSTKGKLKCWTTVWNHAASLYRSGSSKQAGEGD